MECCIMCPGCYTSLLLKMYNPVGLVLTGDDETALECFESLIHLAKEQLNHVRTEKSKLPPLTPEEREEIYRKVCSPVVWPCMSYTYCRESAKLKLKVHLMTCIVG